MGTARKANLKRLGIILATVTFLLYIMDFVASGIQTDYRRRELDQREYHDGSTARGERFFLQVLYFGIVSAVIARIGLAIYLRMMVRRQFNTGDSRRSATNCEDALCLLLLSLRHVPDEVYYG